MNTNDENRPRGRPKKRDKRSKRLYVRLSEKEKTMLHRVADALGAGMSNYARGAIIRRMNEDLWVLQARERVTAALDAIDDLEP